MKKIVLTLALILGCVAVNDVMAQSPEGGQRPPRPQMGNHSDTPAGKEVLAFGHIS